jgi:hypothetical protein
LILLYNLAKAGLIDTCPGCGQPVVAKCGEHRIHHWAHKSNKTCDSWWEPETEWHRNWKSNFPVEWQECFLPDEQTGEKYIADVKSAFDFVVEFQHSAIKPEERISREKFYKNMVWVVDGTRLKRDWPRFQKESGDRLMNTGHPGFFFIHWPEEMLPKMWLECSVPVIFDFMDITTSDDSQTGLKETLWCLLPGRAEGKTVICGINCKDFINRVLEDSQLFADSADKLVAAFANNIRQHRQAEQNHRTNAVLQRRMWAFRRRRF